jgi:hypothetical protein
VAGFGRGNELTPMAISSLPSEFAPISHQRQSPYWKRVSIRIGLKTTLLTIAVDIVSMIRRELVDMLSLRKVRRPRRIVAAYLFRDNRVQSKFHY